MKLHKMLFLATVQIATLGGFSQNWTLQQCIEHAKASNISIKTRGNHIENQGINLQRARNEALPSVSAYSEASINNSYQLSERKTFNTGQIGVSAEVDIWNGHRVKHEVEKQKTLLEVSGLHHQSVTQDVSVSITTSFLDLVYQTENVKNIENQMKVTLEQLSITKLKVESGVMARFELSRMQMVEAQEVASLMEAKNQQQLSTLKLGLLLNLRGDSLKNFSAETTVTTNIETLTIEDVDTVFSNASKANPDLLAKQKMLDSYASDVKIARSSAMPHVYAKGLVYTGYNGINNTGITASEVSPFVTQMSDNINAQVVVGVNIPIFNKHNTKLSVMQSKTLMAASQLEVEQKRNELFLQTHTSWLEAKSSQEQFNAREKAAQLANESFELSKERYNAGTLDGISFVMEKNNLAKAQSDLLLAKYMLIFRIKMLDILQGRAITL